MRDVISGEYLPLTIGQFCNILPDNGDEIVAPLRVINRESSLPLARVCGEKGEDSPRRRNGPVIALHAREIDTRNSVISHAGLGTDASRARTFVRRSGDLLRKNSDRTNHCAIEINLRGELTPTNFPE